MSWIVPTYNVNDPNHVVARWHQAFIPPDFSDVAIRSLECTSKVFSLGGPFGLRSKHEVHTFYERDAEGYICFKAGLVPRVIDDLRCLGVDAQVDDRTRWPVLEQAAETLAAIVTDKNRSLLNAVVTSPRGHLITSGVQQQSDFIRDVSQLFLDRRILIVTSNGEQRNRIHGFLSSFLDRPVFTHRNINWFARNRIVVVTTQSFGINPLNDDWDVILFASPEAVVGTQAFDMASRVEKELTYCLRPRGFNADVLTLLRLEAICGPVIHDDLASRPSVQVVMVETPSIRVTAEMSALARKRSTIWHNEKRNDIIAKIALAIAGQDVSTFSHRGEFLGEHVDLLGKCSNPGIAILVESTEHGRELLRHLPHWTLHTAIPDDDGALHSGTCHRSIVTQTFASHGVFANILVRATGTSSPLMVRGFPSIGQRGAIVLFDMADDFDGQAIRDTHERIHDYESRGWPVEAGSSWIANQEIQEKTGSQNGRGARA